MISKVGGSVCLLKADPSTHSMMCHELSGMDWTLYDDLPSGKSYIHSKERAETLWAAWLTHVCS